MRGIVGALVDVPGGGERFLALADIDAALARVVEPEQLAVYGIGQLRHRDSPGITGGYIANGCVHCDALLGRFALEDILAEKRAAGVPLTALAIGITVELPLAARRAPRPLLAIR